MASGGEVRGQAGERANASPEMNLLSSTDAGASSQETEPTPFERAVSDAAAEIFAAGKTGYAWRPVDELLLQELGIGSTRCKKASGSGRAANVFTESNPMDIDLYLVFVSAGYSVDRFRNRAKQDVGRFPKVRTVAIADRTSGMWRVKEIVEREGIGLSEKIRDKFPLVTESDVHEVPNAFSSEGGGGEQESEEAENGPAPVEGAEVVPFEDEEVFASDAAAYSCHVEDFDVLLRAFEEFARDSDVDLDLTNAVDVLAVLLSSQFVLFAGPSGTGKSTLARLLARFFTADEAWSLLEARRQWIGPEDAFGYYSPITGGFASTPDTIGLIDLHEASLRTVRTNGGADEDGLGLPILLVEEANLSAIEGYLAPVVHGVSSPSEPYVRWNLHARQSGVKDLEGALVIPPKALLGPFPRFLGTLNVDQTSQAPARKVSARASVVLLEAQERFDPAGAAESFVEASASGSAVRVPAPGRRWMGDPAAARRLCTLEQLREFTEAIAVILQATSNEGGEATVHLSHRDLERAMNYMAYFVRIGEAAGDPALERSELVSLAAENVLLHVVLPNLPAEGFRSCAQALLRENGRALAEPSTHHDRLGGLLLPRLRRLHAATTGVVFAEALDFWASLS